jgi:hypothetical protein
MKSRARFNNLGGWARLRALTSCATSSSFARRSAIDRRHDHLFHAALNSRGVNGYLGMDTKQSSDLPPEPDLQEHQRLIDRAITQAAVRHIARQAGRPGPAPRVMIWQLVMVSFAALLFIVAVAALLVAGILP